MEDEEITINNEQVNNQAPVDPESPIDASAEPETDPAAETPSEEAAAEPEQTPEQRIAELEFDNYRKRTIQEKADLIKYGSQKAIEALLPVIDDLERAMQHIDKAEDTQSVKEGVELIMQKFQGYLKQQQVTVIPANPGDDFDDKIHEAITMFPAPDPSLKGKIVDCPTKGYKLYDKVVRYAKVVVGQ